MKVINVKKLIISTLIFLFSSFNEPVLASEPSQMVQEATGVDITQPFIIGLKGHADLRNICAQMVSPQFALMQSLELRIFSGVMPKVVLGPYTDERGGYIVREGVQELRLEKAIGKVIRSPKEYGVHAEVALQKSFPLLYTAPGYVGELIVVPEWKNSEPRMMSLFVEYTFLSFYTAFQGFKQQKGMHIHTRITESFSRLVLQCVAASLIPNLQLTVHVDDMAQIAPLQKFYSQHRDKSVREILLEL